MITNVKRLLRYLLFLVPFAVSSAVYAQDNGAIVECRLAYPDTIKAGDSMLVTVILDIAPGYYIYAPTEMNRMQNLQIMKLSFAPPPAGIIRSGALVIPQHSLKGPFQVYQGKDVRFSQRFATGKDMKTGAYILKVKLVTQACNDQICYPPVTETIDAVIHVVPE